MIWYIDDLNRRQIAITNLWQDLTIPKFELEMEVNEPYLSITWKDGQRGGTGLPRTITIDYRDVESGYYGDIESPVSAEDLRDQIEAMIDSAWTDIEGSGGLPQNIIDALVNNTSSPDGVNTFVTQAELAAALVASGQFLTPELFQDGNTTGTGANQFLDDLGYSDATAAIAWPLTAANYPGGLTAADFTLDTVTWQEMCLTAENIGASYMTTPGSGKSYYVNKTIYLPRTQNVASNLSSLSFIFDFKGCRIRNSSGGDMILFDRYPVDQDDADTLISYQYCFWNGVIRGNGGVTDDDTLFRIGATSRTEFRNMNFEHAGVIADLQFCLEPIFDNCNISDYGEYGLKIWNGQWSGAGFFNAQSNVPSINHFRSYNSPGNTPVAAIYCNGNHTVSGDVWTFEGDVGSEHHFFYDNDGSAGVNLGSIGKIYMEFAGCSRAAIRVRAGKGQFIIRDFRSSIDETDMPVLIEGDNDRDPTSSIELYIEKSAHGTIDSKFRAVGDPDYPVLWFIEDVRLNDNTQPNVAANFETGVIANSYVPDDDHVRFISTDARGSVVWVDGVTITGQGTEADPFVAAAATVEVDGETVSGDGSVGDPLRVIKETFQISANFGWNPVDGTTVYFSGSGSVAQSANVVGKRIYPAQACTLMGISLNWGATSTAGSGEDISMYVRLNDTTDYLVQTVGNTNADKIFENLSMNGGSGIAFNGTSDFWFMKGVMPTFSSNPTAVQLQGTAYYILT